MVNYRAIRRELELYDVKLAERPEITVVSKCELPDAEELRQRLSAELGRDVLAISAVTGSGLNQLLGVIVQHLDERPAAAAAT